MISALAVLTIAAAAGCKSVRRVEAEHRQLSLDIRERYPYQNTIIGTSEALPVHTDMTSEDLHKPLTLRRALELAVQGDPEIRRWQAKIDEATGRRRELETMGWLELIFGISYSPDWKLGLDTPDTATGDRMSGNTLRFGVTARQPIYFEWQRRRAMLNSNTEKINSLYNHRDEEVNKVIAEVCIGYIDLMQAQMQTIHRKNIYELDRKRVAMVTKLVDKRMLLDSDLHQARKFMAAAERDYHEACVMIEHRKRRLKNLLGIDPRIEINFDDIKFEDIPFIPYEQGVEYLINNSSLLTAYDHDVKMAFWDKEYMRWEDIDSDILIHYGYDFYGGSPADDFGYISWTLRYPLLHVKARNARVVQGLKRMEQFEIEREVNQQKALHDLDEIYSNLEEKSSEVDSMLSALEEAKNDMRLAKVFEAKGTPDRSMKSDPNNVLLSVITAVKAENSRFDLIEAELDYLREQMKLYQALNRSAELVEFATERKFTEETAAFRRTIFVDDVLEIAKDEKATKELMDFCKIETIGTIIVDFKDPETDREIVERFLKQARRSDIKVVFTMGGAEWAEASDETIRAELEAFRAYNEPEIVEEPKFGDCPKPEDKKGEKAEEKKAEKDEDDLSFSERRELEVKERTAEVEKTVYEKFDGVYVDLGGRKPIADNARIKHIMSLVDELKQQRTAELDAAMKTDERFMLRRHQQHQITITTALPADTDADTLKAVDAYTDGIALIVDMNDQVPIVEKMEKMLFDELGGKGRYMISLNVLPKMPGKESYAQRLGGDAIFFGEMAEIADKLCPHRNFAGVFIEDYTALRALKAGTPAKPAAETGD